MYLCQICQAPSKPGEDRLVHCLYREDKSILREVPVCAKCKMEIDAGIPFKMLVLRNKKVPTCAPAYKEGQARSYKVVETLEGRVVIPINRGKTKKQRRQFAPVPLEEAAFPPTQLVVNKPLSIGKPVTLSGERVEAPK